MSSVHIGAMLGAMLRRTVLVAADQVIVPMRLYCGTWSSYMLEHANIHEDVDYLSEMIVGSHVICRIALVITALVR